MTTVTMPSLAESMEDGVISRWLKREGERVEQDEELVEIETEKVTMAYQAPEAGYLEIVAPAGAVVEVGAVIARLASEPAAAVPPPAVEQLPPALVAPEPRSAPEPESEPQPQSEPQSEPQPQPVAAPAVAARAVATNGEVRATPLARQLADLHGADLALVGGSGPRGRVTRRDVALSLGLETAAIPAPPRAAAPAVTPGPAVPQGLSRIQQTIARRMSESHAAVPDFQVETEVAMNQAVALREELKQLDAGGAAPSLNDFVIRACALALREHPRVNGSYRENEFVLFDDVNVGMAVATDDSLIVPVVAGADRLTLAGISAETRRLADRVRHGTIEPRELSGATFTVSNLGMFGMTAITPIIDAPQAAILGVGSIRDTLALQDGAVVEHRLMTLRLSCDHRILYGADAARFLSTIRGLLEQPLRLLI